MTKELYKIVDAKQLKDFVINKFHVSINKYSNCRFKKKNQEFVEKSVQRVDEIYEIFY